MRTVLATIILLAALTVWTAHTQAAPLPMRPYSGIGILQITTPSAAIQLYEEPGLARSEELLPATIAPLTNWLFGTPATPHLLVTSRRGDWLKIERDDAGRTAWLLPERGWQFSTWDHYLKGRSVCFLRNAPKTSQNLLPSVTSTSGQAIPPRTLLRIVTVQDDWAYVLFNNSTGGWIRWRDRDGRLLIGIAQTSSAQSR